MIDRNKELRETISCGREVCALLPEPGCTGVVKVQEWPAVPAAMTH